MNPKSLRLRLALASAISISVALVLAGVGLTSLFERHVERRVELELTSYLRQLVGILSFAHDGSIKLDRPLSDPRFDKPLSGLYWQVEEDSSGTILRSRSLWDHSIALPRTDNRSELHRYVLPGPNNENILVLERLISSEENGKNRLLRIAAAVNRSEVTVARRAFANDLTLSLALLAAILLLATWLQIAVGLKPMEDVRKSVAGVRKGKQRRISVDEPTEVMPLVTEVNSLLDGQEKAMARAKVRAADLAHGLKTPLTILGTIAERLRDKGDTAIASEIEDLANAMVRHTSRELSLARMHAASGGQSARTSIRSVADGLIRTLSRSPKGEQIKWTVDIPEDASAAMPVDDLAELLGALLENTVKWAEGRVVISTEPVGHLRVVIEDDGPGVSPAQLQRLGRRGVRLDESVEGSGLGLAIATDIADAYGMSLEFGNCKPHGFRAVINQPARNGEAN